MVIYEQLPVDIKSFNKIVRQYETLDFHHELIQLLASIFPAHSFSTYKKYDLHQAINSLILQHYSGEPVIKYALFNTFKRKKNIGAFEIKVKNSRADFLCVNGYSSSFEIKSELDNLDKLAKQASDYVRAFDFNYVVIDQKHLAAAKELVPRSFGIWSFSGIRKKIHREAKLNKSIDPAFQLNLLTKKERTVGFKLEEGNSDKILSTFKKSEINQRFKDLLKQRYFQRWNFITKHAEQILPIDLQFFFNTNINPALIYHH